MATKTTELTPKAKIALAYLQGLDAPVTGAEIAEATELNAKGIHGVLNGLVKRGLVEKGDKISANVMNKDGVAEERQYVTYMASEDGTAYVID